MPPAGLGQFDDLDAGRAEVEPEQRRLSCDAKRADRSPSGTPLERTSLRNRQAASGAAPSLAGKRAKPRYPSPPIPNDRSQYPYLSGVYRCFRRMALEILSTEASRRQALRWPNRQSRKACSYALTTHRSIAGNLPLASRLRRQNAIQSSRATSSAAARAATRIDALARRARRNCQRRRRVIDGSKSASESPRSTPSPAPPTAWLRRGALPGIACRRRLLAARLLLTPRVRGRLLQPAADRRADRLPAEDADARLDRRRRC